MATLLGCGGFLSQLQRAPLLRHQIKARENQFMRLKKMGWTSIKQRISPHQRERMKQTEREREREREGACFGCCTYPKEGVERPVLHELCDDHDRSALGDHTLQADDVGVVKLPHDWSLGQEVTSLLLRIACFQCFDGNVDLSFSRQFQSTFIHLPELSWGTQRRRISERPLEPSKNNDASTAEQQLQFSSESLQCYVLLMGDAFRISEKFWLDYMWG